MTATRGRACDGKIPYPSRREAVDAAWYLMREKGAVRLNAYKCKFCGQFHIGHRPRNPGDSKRRKSSWTTA